MNLVPTTTVGERRLLSNLTSKYRGWSGEFMLAANSQHHTKSNCLGKAVKQYPAGTIIQVWEIVDEFGGESGDCWRVKVVIRNDEINSALVDVPACWFWHPESWVTSSSPRAPVVLWFKPVFAVRLAPNT